MITGELTENRVMVWGDSGKDTFENGFFGKLKEDRLELALIEACYLLETKKLEVKKNGKKVTFDKLFDYCSKIDERFNFRYQVYKDLREKDMPVKTGFKFGCDFRVYNKGVKPVKHGPKGAGEHTKWIVFTVPRGHKSTFAELSRAVRLAHNIRANMLWAVIDEDNKIKYIQTTFFKP